jgi:hypothetical protein
MKKEEFDYIIQNESKLKDLPNSELIRVMDLLSSDFEMTKKQIIDMTFYLDKIEELYNKSLEIYKTRVS